MLIWPPQGHPGVSLPPLPQHPLSCVRCPVGALCLGWCASLVPAHPQGPCLPPQGVPCYALCPHWYPACTPPVHPCVLAPQPTCTPYAWAVCLLCPLEARMYVSLLLYGLDFITISQIDCSTPILCIPCWYVVVLSCCVGGFFSSRRSGGFRASRTSLTPDCR